jgi:DNA polymerase-3 subunit beta
VQFIILRETLLKLLRIVSGVVERRHQHSPVLANVLLRLVDQRLSITATDQEVEIIAAENVSSVQSAGATTVPFRKLHDICKALPEHAELTLETHEDKITIKSGRSKFVLATLAADQFPDVQNLSNNQTACRFGVSKKQFRWLIARTSFAMADQDVRYFLNGMLLEVKNNCLYAVAADGHRLAMNYLVLAQAEITPVRVIVPRKGVLEIMRMLDEGEDDLQVTIVANHIQFYSDGVTVTSKLLDGKFPDYERVIPRNGDKVVIGNRERLKEAFHRAAASSWM